MIDMDNYSGIACPKKKKESPKKRKKGSNVQIRELMRVYGVIIISEHCKPAWYPPHSR